MLTIWKSVSTGIPVNIRRSYDFSRSRTKFIIWLRILPGATGIPLSSEILPEHSIGVALVLLKFKIQRDIHIYTEFPELWTT